MFTRIAKAYTLAQAISKGAKKKKNEDIVRATTTGPYEVINLFKARKDPPILPLDQYPTWLAELLENKKPYHQYLVSAYEGKDVLFILDHST